MAVSGTENDIKIRKADTEDSRHILEVIRLAFSDYEAGGQSPALRETPAAIKEDINKNHVLVVEIKGKIVGTLRLELKGGMPELKDTGEQTAGYYLKRFAIHPGYQGQGLGTMLFEKAEKIACREDVSSIFLHSTTGDERLVKFYKKLGFQCEAVDHSRGYPRGLWVKKLC